MGNQNVKRYDVKRKLNNINAACILFEVFKPYFKEIYLNNIYEKTIPRNKKL